MQDLGVPALGMENAELADILRGYRNALDAALMATRLISGGPGGRQLPTDRHGQPIPNSRRTDIIEVCDIHADSAVCCFVQIVGSHLSLLVNKLWNE